MSYAQVTDGTITTVAGRLPNAARRLDNRAWVLAFPSASVELHEACGWFPVVDVPRPADSDTTTTDRSVELVAGTPTVVWTPRPWTPEESAARTAETNRTTIDAAIDNALAELLQIVNAPDVPTVAAGTMTTAQLSNSLRAMRDVVQQNRVAIRRVAGTLRHTIRMVRGDYEGTD